MKIFNTIGGVAKFAFSKAHYDKASQWKPEMGSMYDLKANDLDGKPFDMQSLKGKVTLVCNVASECGYTKCGYQFLEEEQKKYADRNFTVLGFPCNQFGGQESGGPQDIRDFAVKSFNVTFPLLEKTDVNGPNTHSVFSYLKGVYPGDVSWNFHGLFVVNEDGIPVGRFNKEPYPLIDEFINKTRDERDKRLSSSASTASSTTATTTTESTTTSSDTQ